MKSMKVWIAVAMAVLVVGVGAVIATSFGGGGGKPATTATSVPASAAAAGANATANDQVAQQLVGNLLNQITQAATSPTGQPQVLTKEQAEELLRQQLQQLGIQPPK